MLQWLVTTLPVNRLEGPPIVRGIDFLHNTFNSSHYQAYIPTMSAREISAAMHAAYVLNAYDQRVFVPADPPPATEPAKAEKPDRSRPAEPARRGKLALPVLGARVAKCLLVVPPLGGIPPEGGTTNVTAESRYIFG